MDERTAANIFDGLLIQPNLIGETGGIFHDAAGMSFSFAVAQIKCGRQRIQREVIAVL